MSDAEKTREGTTPPLCLRKRIAFSLATAFISLVIVLAGGEVFVRLFRSHWTMEDLRGQRIQYDSSIFCRAILRKEAHLIKDILQPDSEGIPINSKGYRGPEFSASKPEGTTRIVVMGGSSVFGFMLKGPEADWPRRLERLLRERGRKNVECINAGVPGHAMFDSLGRYYAEVYKYQPDWIVLYQTVNDIKYFQWLGDEETLLARFRAYDARKDPRVNYIGWWDRALCHSQLYLKLRTRYYDRKYRPLAESIDGEGQGGRSEATVAENRSLPEDGFHQFELNVRLLCDAARQTGAKVMIVTQARLALSGQTGRVDVGHLDLLRMDEPTLAETFVRCDGILKKVAEEKGAVFVDAASIVSQDVGNFFDLIHLKPEGAEALAAVLAERFDGLLKEGDE